MRKFSQQTERLVVALVIGQWQQMALSSEQAGILALYALEEERGIRSKYLRKGLNKESESTVWRGVRESK